MSPAIKTIAGHPQPIQHEDEFWIELAKDWIRVAFDKQVSAAKQIINISGILQGIYFIVIIQNINQLSELNEFNQDLIFILVLTFISPSLCWLYSMYLSTYVVVPVVYSVDPNKKDDIIDKFNKRVARNKKHLSNSHKWLLLGLVIVMLNIIIYSMFLMSK